MTGKSIQDSVDSCKGPHWMKKEKSENLFYQGND